MLDQTTDKNMLCELYHPARIGGHLRDDATVHLKSYNDVKGVVLTLHKILSRDGDYRSIHRSRTGSRMRLAC